MSNGFSFQSARYAMALLAIVVAAWFGAPSEASADPSVLEKFDSSPVMVPAHATTRVHTSDGAYAPLSVETPDDGKYYYIKLQQLPGCNTLTQSIAPDFVVPDCDVMDVFVHGGETVKLRVPPGEYVVKYSSGKVWYGYQYLFGPNGSYNAAEDNLEFKIEDGKVKGFIIKLYEVADGNLKTEVLNWGSF